jgi:two-component system, OmpR family, catabolic regulation response regulator CreB
MSIKSILVVEDEPNIAAPLIRVLKEQGFDAIRVATIFEAKNAMKNNNFSAIVLDIGLPDGNGFDFCKELRKSNNIPILFLTALSDEVDKIVGLEIGADDYMTKPFSSREVSAKLKAILRRVNEPTSDIRDSQFKIDDAKKRITYKGDKVSTSNLEYKILKLLIESPGKVFSRDEIMDHCWDLGVHSSDRTVDTHIKTIRKKLKDINPEIDPKKILKTHTGTGFYLDE